MMLFAILAVTQTQPSVADLLHQEDAKVFEAALLGYWAKGKPESKTIYVPEVTTGPVRPEYDEIVDGSFEKRPVPIDQDLRRSYLVRNASPVSLSWFKPQSKALQLVPKDDWKKRNTWSSAHRFELRQYSWLLMPGYNYGRTQALVCFGFNWSIHSGQATVWLSKIDGVWKVAEFRDVFYV